MKKGRLFIDTTRLNSNSIAKANVEMLPKPWKESHLRFTKRAKKRFDAFLESWNDRTLTHSSHA